MTAAVTERVPCTIIAGEGAKAELHRQAKLAGMSVSAYVRTTLGLPDPPNTLGGARPGSGRKRKYPLPDDQGILT